MSGFERFSSYVGYARSFEYAGPYHELSAARPTLIAIDATQYDRHHVMRQFAPDAIERELNKAYVGFSRPLSSEARALAEADARAAEEEEAADAAASAAAAGAAATGTAAAGAAAAAAAALLPPLCTGNWGCGAFGGDLQLKALIQWAAASLAQRPRMLYRTFGDEELASGLRTVAARLQALECTVGQLAGMLRTFKPHKFPPPPSVQGAAGYYADIFNFLHARCKRVEASRRTAPDSAANEPGDGCEAAGEAAGGEVAGGEAVATPPTWPRPDAALLAQARDAETESWAQAKASAVAEAAEAAAEEGDAAAEIEAICAAAEQAYALTGSAQKAGKAAAAAQEAANATDED